MSDFNTTISFDVFSVSLSFVDEGTFIVVKQYVDEQLDSKQDTLIAGENITIVGNVISSTTGGGSIEHDDTLNKNSNPDFLHINEEEKNLITSTADIVSGHTEDIVDLQINKADKETTLLGYGITDAYTQTEIDTKIDNIEHDNTLNKNINSLFLHATQSQHDRWTNNYTYKIEDTSVSVWVASTEYADFAFEAQINIANLSEDDFVNVVFGVNEAVSGNYAPAIEQYAGYILVFSKVNTAITIPTISVTKIDL